MLQVDAGLKWLTLLVLLFTEVLILSTLVKESKWNLATGFSFFVFLAVIVFALFNIFGQNNSVISIAIILAQIVGFFIAAFSPEPVKMPAPVSVFQMEPQIEVIKYNRNRTAATKKATTKRKPAKKKTS